MKKSLAIIFLVSLGMSPALANPSMHNAIVEATQTVMTTVDPTSGDDGGSSSEGGTTEGGETDPAAQKKKTNPNPCGGMDMMFILVFFGIFWFFIIRPQSKKQKDHQSFVSGLKKGETVVTQGGIIGRISDFDDTTGAVLLEVDKNTKIRVVRGHISGPLSTPSKDDDKEDKDKDKDKK